MAVGLQTGFHKMVRRDFPLPVGHSCSARSMYLLEGRGYHHHRSRSQKGLYLLAGWNIADWNIADLSRGYLLVDHLLAYQPLSRFRQCTETVGYLGKFHC